MSEKKLDEETLLAVMKYCQDEHTKSSAKFKVSHDTYDISRGMIYFDVWNWCYKQTESYKHYKHSKSGENNGE